MFQDSILHLKLSYLPTRVKGVIPEEVSLYGSAFDLYLEGACLGFWSGHHQLLLRHLWVYLVTAGKCQVGTLKWATLLPYTSLITYTSPAYLATLHRRGSFQLALFNLASYATLSYHMVVCMASHMWNTQRR